MIEKLDTFLTLNEHDILTHHGKVSKDIALALAYSEYEKYRVQEDRLTISDFDKLLSKLEK